MYSGTTHEIESMLKTIELPVPGDLVKWYYTGEAGIWMGEIALSTAKKFLGYDFIPYYENSSKELSKTYLVLSNQCVVYTGYDISSGMLEIIRKIKDCEE